MNSFKLLHLTICFVLSIQMMNAEATGSFAKKACRKSKEAAGIVVGKVSKFTNEVGEEMNRSAKSRIYDPNKVVRNVVQEGVIDPITGLIKVTSKKSAKQYQKFTSDVKNKAEKLDKEADENRNKNYSSRLKRSLTNSKLPLYSMASAAVAKDKVKNGAQKFKKFWNEDEESNKSEKPKSKSPTKKPKSPKST